MEPLASLRERSTRERCPYCHDELESAGEARIECPGCGTSHHAVCLDELGRCSILGCERALASPRPERRRGDSGRLSDQVRERIRRRVQSFVRDHVHPPRRPFQPLSEASPPPKDDPVAQARRREYVRTLERAREAVREEHWLEGAQAYRELADLVGVCRTGDLDGVLGQVGRGDALERARELEQLGARRRGARHYLVALVVIGLGLVYGGVILLTALQGR